MSGIDMKSQGSDDSDYNNDTDDNMEDEDIYDGYYDAEIGDDEFEKPTEVKDPEAYDYRLLEVEDVERLLNEKIETLCTSLKLSPSLAKVLLYQHNWDTSTIQEKHTKDPNKLLIEAKVMPKTKPLRDMVISRNFSCPVCMCLCPSETVHGLACGHRFCQPCWEQYFQMQLSQGLSSGIECMGNECHVLATEDFVLDNLGKPEMRDKYSRFAFQDYVESHLELRFCPGPNCQVIVRAENPKAKRVICGKCKTSFCFKCGIEYHAPTDCSVIKKWLTKCADDSETANYISAHTKDCPKCHVCIEKNGGCNHLQCVKCKHDFCWMCLGDWKNHGSEYYECSRYKENPNIANESAHAQAREALKKYLFYFERYENHAKSLRLEEETLDKIKTRIEEKVMNNTGTWIDWQYLLDAADLLKKCRYTLQFTYPYAYYLEKGSRKTLFEYQQAQLEAEVENLSWKVERAEITDRGDLENQMDVAEKRRLTLVRDFVTE
ncbi:unnamed protein product [Owenia fusiformis]|uniref:RBR-type E3 ubiquitin transferase n=1 Tax=Owenia fusiformis TaxID=6347 RepID=A0A8S4NPC7_OWEFU|nr:unnamed protein product [Owenia fusiformis]